MFNHPLLTCQQLACQRGNQSLWSDLNFTLHEGEALQITGNNGSGKTSLLRILAGLMTPSAGHLYWRQHQLPIAIVEYHRQLFYLSHQPAINQELTVRENLQYHLQRPNVSSSKLHDLIDQALFAMDLTAQQQTLCRQLSQGQKQRVALARLHLSQAPLWILDEPFTALDHCTSQQLDTLLQQHIQQQGTLILTSHRPLSTTSLVIRTIDLSLCKIQKSHSPVIKTKKTLDE